MPAHVGHLNYCKSLSLWWQDWTTSVAHETEVSCDLSISKKNFEAIYREKFWRFRPHPLQRLSAVFNRGWWMMVTVNCFEKLSLTCDPSTWGDGTFVSWHLSLQSLGLYCWQGSINQCTFDWTEFIMKILKIKWSQIFRYPYHGFCVEDFQNDMRQLFRHLHPAFCVEEQTRGCFTHTSMRTAWNGWRVAWPHYFCYLLLLHFAI